MTRKKPKKKPTPPAPTPPSSPHIEYQYTEAGPPQPPMKPDKPSHDWAVVAGIVALGALVFVGVNKDWIFFKKPPIPITVNTVITGTPYAASTGKPNVTGSNSTLTPIKILDPSTLSGKMIAVCPPPPKPPHHQRPAVEQYQSPTSIVPSIIEPQMNDPTIWE
jgi:hypothetical protein